MLVYLYILQITVLQLLQSLFVMVLLDYWSDETSNLKMPRRFWEIVMAIFYTECFYTIRHTTSGQATEISPFFWPLSMSTCIEMERKCSRF